MPETTKKIEPVLLRVNGQKDYPVAPGQTLLEALRAQGIFVASACGGRGACGLCRTRVLTSMGELTEKERIQLSDDERRNGLRLACQVTLNRSLDVQVPDASFYVREHTAEVLSLRNLTYDIKEVRLKLLQPPTMVFQPGQYLQFRIPPYAGSRKIMYRAYSIASVPSRPDELELEIRRVPHGLGTTYVFNVLKPGQKVFVNGPYGDFFLRDTDRDIVFIAGGSGMAPIKSILLNMEEHGSRRPARYFFGARAMHDLFFVEEMKRLETTLPDFQFIPALSQPLPEDNWKGETGLITDVVDRHVSEGSGAEAYLCGSPAMIDACVRTLSAKGIPRERIFFDKF